MSYIYLTTEWFYQTFLSHCPFLMQLLDQNYFIDICLHFVVIMFFYKYINTFYLNIILLYSENVDVIFDKTQSYNVHLNVWLCLGQKSMITFGSCFYFKRGNWSEACGYSVLRKGSAIGLFLYEGNDVLQFVRFFPPCACTWKTSLFSSLKSWNLYFSLELLNFKMLSASPLFFSIIVSSFPCSCNCNMWFISGFY